MDIGRQPIPMLPLDRRTGMTEVEVGSDEQTAMEEAQRCLQLLDQHGFRRQCRSMVVRVRAVRRLRRRLPGAVP